MPTRFPRFLATFVILLSASLAQAIDQEFSLDTSKWTEQPKTVNLAGEFNGWNMNATAMTDPDGDRVWTTTIKLDEGLYMYKFVIDAGSEDRRWINDPNADKELEAADGNGGNNSGILVGPDFRKLPEPKPDHINTDAVLFNRNDPTDFNLSPNGIRIRVRTQAGDVQGMKARWSIPTARAGSEISLSLLGKERGADIWGGMLDLPKYPTFDITIECWDGSAHLGTSQNAEFSGLSRTDVSRKFSGFQVDGTKANEFTTPAWAADAQWYQIFVERFRNGDTSNDPGDFEYERLVPWNGDWFSTLPGEAAGEENFYNGEGNVWKRRYGGDIAGMKEKLPYLKELGINALYLNPMFEAESMHKYDTADYRHIDDNFGARDSKRHPKQLGNRELYELDGTPVAPGYVQTDEPSTWKWTKSDLIFLDFIKAAHAQGMYVVIDGVFNHVGRASPFFMDVLEKGKKSKYADWFEITDWGDEKNWKPMDEPFEVHGMPGGIQWRAWDKDNGHLPAFKKNAETGLAQGPADHVNGITRRWLDPDNNPDTRDGIDGWRLDVAGDIPHPFWREWRKVVKGANPDAYINGEIWSEAQPWINAGDQFDAVMNYQFAYACVDFFVDQKLSTKPSEFVNRLVKLQYLYPMQATLVMQNLFDSHDTDRVASKMINPDRSHYDDQNRLQDNAAETGYESRKPTDEEWKKIIQMVAFQQTFVGAPMTYYGSEVGMWSPDDPSNRQPVPWDDRGPYQSGVGFNKKIFDEYKKWISIRNSMPVLRRGFFAPISADDSTGVVVFERSLGEDRAIVVVNRSNKAQSVKIDVPNGTYIDHAMSDSKLESDGSLTIKMPAWGVSVLTND